jgi:4a-hydroxytetrahydrobiopterin dehydratase
LDSNALLSIDQIKQELTTSLPLWELRVNGEDGVSVLSRKFIAMNFQAALDCVNSMGAIAEREGHHPDFHLTNYRHVEVVLYTHKLQGITGNDLRLARTLDEEVKIEYSPQWLKNHPS